MSEKSDNEVEAEPSPKRQKTSGDEADAAEPKATPEKKKDEAADEDGEAKPAADKDGEAKPAADKDGEDEGEGEDKDGEGRKRKLGDVKNDAEELVSKLMERPLAKKADVRGRRMLGAMMGHLVSAKSRLKDEGLLDPSKRRATEAKVDRAAQEKETQYLERRLEKHYTAMKNFIRTRAEPTIFYLPKQHTQKTQSRLDETRDAVEQKIKALKVHLRAASYDPLEDTKREEQDDKNDEKDGKAEATNGKAEDKKEEEKKAADSGTEDESAPEDKTDKADAARAKAAKADKKSKSKSKSRSPSAASAKAAEEPQAERKKSKSKSKSRSPSAASSK